MFRKILHIETYIGAEIVYNNVHYQQFSVIYMRKYAIVDIFSVILVNLCIFVMWIVESGTVGPFIFAFDLALWSQTYIMQL